MSPATETSVESWASHKGAKCGRQQMMVLAALKELGPATAKEITAHIHAKHGGDSDDYQKRCPELVEKGLAERRPARTCRITGKTATEWAAKDSRAAVDSPLLDRSGPAISAGPSFTGERRFRDESPRVAVAPDAPLLTARPVVCPCGTANGMTCGCGVTYCKAFGHARHNCGAAR